MPATSALHPPGRWRRARLVDARRESTTARTLVLKVDRWAGHNPGQHLDVRLTASTGYTAQHSYSIASAPSGTETLDLTVQEVPGGEVSSYLVHSMLVGDELEIRGPIGGWFRWSPDMPGRVLLVAGGAGIVPVMAMLRHRTVLDDGPPFTLVYASRSPEQVIYAEELQRMAVRRLVDLTLAYTRSAPVGYARPAGRVSLSDLPLADHQPWRIYVCGPNGFVRSSTDLLLHLGHGADTIRTERFGMTGDPDARTT